MKVRRIIAHTIDDMFEKYDAYSVLCIFGGAAQLYDKHNHIMWDKLPLSLTATLQQAKICEWHETPVETLERFCRIALIDSKVVQDYLGVTFEEFITTLKAKGIIL